MSSVASNRVLFVMSLAGIGISGYLTLAHLNFVDIGCSAFHGCEEVNAHYTSSGFGIPLLRAIPTAAFGLAMYVFAAGLCVVRAGAEGGLRDRKAANLQWIVTAGALLVTAWLTYLEAFVIHAWCQWCLASAIVILIMFVTATAERLFAPPPAQGVAH